MEIKESGAVGGPRSGSDTSRRRGNLGVDADREMGFRKGVAATRVPTRCVAVSYEWIKERVARQSLALRFINSKNRHLTMKQGACHSPITRVAFHPLQKQTSGEICNNTNTVG